MAEAEEERLGGEWPMVEAMVKAEEEGLGVQGRVEPMAEAEMQYCAAVRPGGVETTASSECPGGHSTDEEE